MRGSAARSSPAVWGLALAAIIIGVAVTGALLLRSKDLDPVSARTVPPALDRIVALLPPGSTLVDKATRVTANNYKTIGRVVFVSSLSGPESRDRVVAGLALSNCGEGQAVFRTDPCGQATPEDLIVRILTSPLGEGRKDPARVALGDRAEEFPTGAPVVEIIVGSE